VSQSIPNASHEDGTEQVLERDERVVNAQQHGRQFKVNEEDDDPEVDERVRHRNEIGLFVQDEDERRQKRRFRRTVTVRKSKLNTISRGQQIV
jgi:hypothetical protein